MTYDLEQHLESMLNEDMNSIGLGFDTLARERLSEQPELFHYTTIDGLLGILQEHKIRATHIRYLNDRSELSFAANLIRKTLEENLGRWAGSEVVIREALAAFSSIHDGTNYYVACFCQR